MINLSIPTLAEAQARIAAEASALDAKRQRIADLENQAADLNTRAQAANDGSAERDQLDEQHQRTVRQLERARGDIGPLETALAEAEQQRFESLRLAYELDYRHAVQAERTARMEETRLEAALEAAQSSLEAFRAGPLQEAETALRNVSGTIGRVEQGYRNDHPGDGGAYVHSLAQRVRLQVDAAEYNAAPLPG